jgi:hypothetical protein
MAYVMKRQGKGRKEGGTKSTYIGDLDEELHNGSSGFRGPFVQDRDNDPF